MIVLGTYDSSVTQADRDAYLRQAAVISGGRGDQAAEGSDRPTFVPNAADPSAKLSHWIIAQSWLRVDPVKTSLAESVPEMTAMFG